MRVALLYCGLPRMWRECHASQMALFAGAEVHVFCHFWDVVSAEEKAEILAEMKPSYFIFESQPDLAIVDQFTGIRRDSINVPSRIMTQYASWMKLAAIFAPYAPAFDVAVRSRTDLQFHAGITPTLEAVARGELDLAGFTWPVDGSPDVMISDTCAIGTPAVILYFLSLASRVWSYAASTSFNPEALLTAHIRSHPGTLRASLSRGWPYFVRRPGMAGWSLERCIAASPGDTKWQEQEIVEAHLRNHAAHFGEAGAGFVERFREKRLSKLP